MVYTVYVLEHLENDLLWNKCSR